MSDQIGLIGEGNHLLGEIGEYIIRGWAEGYHGYRCLEVSFESIPLGSHGYVQRDRFSHYPAELLSPLQQARMRRRHFASYHESCEFLEGRPCLTT